MPEFLATFTGDCGLICYQITEKKELLILLAGSVSTRRKSEWFSLNYQLKIRYAKAEMCGLNSSIHGKWKSRFGIDAVPPIRANVAPTCNWCDHTSSVIKYILCDQLKKSIWCTQTECISLNAFQYPLLNAAPSVFVSSRILPRRSSVWIRCRHQLEQTRLKVAVYGYCRFVSTVCRKIGAN